LTPQESSVIDSVENALRWFARLSPTADSLWQFYRAHARRGVYLTDATFSAVDSARTPKDFWVVIMPYDPPKLGDRAKAGGYHPVTKRLGILRTSLGRVADGLIMAHELVHARQYLIEGHTLAPKGSERWLLDEVEAYQTVSRILNQTTRSRWQREAVIPSLRDRDEFKRRSGMTPWSFTWTSAGADWVRTAKLFGASTRLDVAYLTTQLDFDVNMATVERETRGQPTALHRGTILFMERYCGIVPR